MIPLENDNTWDAELLLFFFIVFFSYKRFSVSLDSGEVSAVITFPNQETYHKLRHKAQSVSQQYWDQRDGEGGGGDKIQTHGSQRPLRGIQRIFSMCLGGVTPIPDFSRTRRGGGKGNKVTTRNIYTFSRNKSRRSSFSSSIWCSQAPPTGSPLGLDMCHEGLSVESGVLAGLLPHTTSKYNWRTLLKFNVALGFIHTCMTPKSQLWPTIMDSWMTFRCDFHATSEGLHWSEFHRLQSSAGTFLKSLCL